MRLGPVPADPVGPLLPVRKLDCPVGHDRQRRHDAHRPSARERGYTGAWEEARRAFLALHPFCAFCGYTATVVDHITPHRGDMALFWDRANWQPLCKPCHDRRKQRLEAEGRR